MSGHRFEERVIPERGRERRLVKTTEDGTVRATQILIRSERHPNDGRSRVLQTFEETVRNCNRKRRHTTSPRTVTPS